MPDDDEAAERAVSLALSKPDIYPIEETLLPAARALAADPKWGAAASVRGLRAACLAHLRARIAEPLAPPADWRRESALGCKCAHCAELSAFLADPATPVWRFRAIQSIRTHVEQTIAKARPDEDRSSRRRA